MENQTEQVNLLSFIYIQNQNYHSKNSMSSSTDKHF